MNRRHFLRNGALTGVALSASTATFAGNSASGKRNFADDFELNEITIDELQSAMQSGKHTSESITKLYLKRIEAMDKKGVFLNAVIELNPDAISIARQLDNERKKGNLRGALHGIPVLVKDNINTGDAMKTTAGALALHENRAKEDAFIIKQLRKAGAVLLGKTNLSEWANFRSTHSASGWSSRGGQTKCPYILDRNPSGSSAGTGAAVAANFCAVGIGTETDGSIVSPSSANGLVGIKPTVGVWSRNGIIPISATQDTAGPMTRTVRDAAILLGALAGFDSSDERTKESKGKAFTDYTKFLKEDGLKGKRIGIEKSHMGGGNPDVVALYKSAIEKVKESGAIIVELDILKTIRAVAGIGDAEYTVLLYEFKDGVNKYLVATGGNIKSLQDVIAFNKKNEAEAMPYFKQEILLSSAEKGDLNTKEYQDALALSLSSRKIIENLIHANQLDALCGVTNGLACCIDLVNGDYDTGFSFSTPAAISGFPHITVPMGFVYNLPVGISFFSTAYTEPQLLSMAYAYEQASHMRKAPGFQKDLLI